MTKEHKSGKETFHKAHKSREWHKSHKLDLAFFAARINRAKILAVKGKSDTRRNVL